MELDPSQFLAQGSSDEEESESEASGAVRKALPQNGNGPSILTSLGLTHINSVSNPFASYAVSFFIPMKKKIQLFIAIIFINILFPNIIFRILTIPLMMIRAKYRVMAENRMLKCQPIVPFVICSFQIEPMHDATKKTFTKFVRRQVFNRSNNNHRRSSKQLLQPPQMYKTYPRR